MPIPPAPVRNAAARGLYLRAVTGRGGAAVGVARARDLANGRNVSERTLKRMRSYFARHAVDRRPGWDKDATPGYVAWLLWGGNPGRAWASKYRAAPR